MREYGIGQLLIERCLTRHYIREHLRFTISSFLTLVTALFVCIGFVAAVDFTAFHQSCEWFGIDWQDNTRSYLIDTVGLSSDFVCGYVTFAMIDLPAWVCYMIVASVLGLIRTKWGLITGLAFITSILLWDWTSDYFSGLHNMIYLRLVSLFGVTIVALCFVVAKKLRGRVTNPSEHNLVDFW